nr:unnamed protein product [Spirometra erinaceieuropaei]
MSKQPYLGIALLALSRRGARKGVLSKCWEISPSASIPGLVESKLVVEKPKKDNNPCILRQSEEQPAGTEDELVAGELARYKVDIAALSETRFSEEGQLEEVGAGYTFRSSRPKIERHDACVVLTIRNDILGRLPCLPQGINDCLMRLRLPLRGAQFATIISAYLPQ